MNRRKFLKFLPTFTVGGLLVGKKTVEDTFEFKEAEFFPEQKDSFDISEDEECFETTDQREHCIYENPHSYALSSSTICFALWSGLEEGWEKDYPDANT